ncbi:1-acyl-sn-glycerol-3-phosphate acyltransferase epsilon [Ixodes scapularis]
MAEETGIDSPECPVCLLVDAEAWNRYYVERAYVPVEVSYVAQVFFHGDMSDVVQKKERAFYVVNHQSTFDWVAVNIFAERTGSPGQLRYIIKQSLQSVPLYGFYFHQHGCIYVNRHQFNVRKMRRSLAYLTNKNMPSSLVIFPEGALFEPGHTAKLKKSDEFALRQGTKCA